MQPGAAQFRFARQLSAGVRTVDMLANRMALKALAFLGLGVSLKLFLGVGVFLSIALVFAAYLATGGWRFAYVVVKTLPRDMR